MKRIITFLIMVLLASSCSTMFYKDYRRITDYNEQMDALKYGFPEVYKLYVNGDVIIDDIFEYTRNGEGRTHITYHYRYK